jgi:6,7-dimethyl-8-ribityllumazine synthase
MADVSNSTLLKNKTGILSEDACVVIVRTEWNADIVDELYRGCVSAIRANGITRIEEIVVPGAIEIPFAVNAYWNTQKENVPRPDAFIALGCIIQGDTPHFDYVCQSVTEGITQLNLRLPVPVTFGVLTVLNIQQAKDRIGGPHGHKGEEAALTALKMIALVRHMSSTKPSPHR